MVYAPLRLAAQAARLCLRCLRSLRHQRRLGLGIMLLAMMLQGCHEPPRTTRMQIVDFDEMAEAMAQSLMRSDALAERGPNSPLWVVSMAKVRNLTSDIMTDSEQWMIMAKLRDTTSFKTLWDQKNVRFVLPPEQAERLRDVEAPAYTDAAPQRQKPTHTLTATFRSVTRGCQGPVGPVLLRVSDARPAHRRADVGGSLRVQAHCPRPCMGLMPASSGREVRRRSHLIIVAVMCIIFSALAGCHTTMDTPRAAMAAGDFAAARLRVRDHLTDDRGDRRYILDRMRLGALTLADGYPQSAQHVFEQTYDMLRTRGINADKTVDAVVFNEGVKIWKGEPFEQALAMAYYGMTQAELGSWDNTRAAAGNALFKLRDFGDDDTGHRLNTYEIARRSLLYERAKARGASDEEARQAADYLDHGYVARDSNFTLGYLLAGIANQQLDRAEEASDNYTRVVEIDPDLEPLVEAFRQGAYNTVLVVSMGLGPRKEGYGPDGALARFTPRFPSDGRPLIVRVGDFQAQTYPQVLDVNAMAADHMWNNLEDIRIAKSYLGTGLLYGGAIAIDIGAHQHSEEAVYAGLGAIGAGLLMKAGAHADTRYCDVYPQRFYVVPLHIDDDHPAITLQVEGQPGTRLVLRGLGSPEGDDAQLRCMLAFPMCPTATRRAGRPAARCITATRAPASRPARSGHTSSAAIACACPPKPCWKTTATGATCAIRRWRNYATCIDRKGCASLWKIRLATPADTCSKAGDPLWRRSRGPQALRGCSASVTVLMNPKVTRFAKPSNKRIT